MLDPPVSTPINLGSNKASRLQIAIEIASQNVTTPSSNNLLSMRRLRIESNTALQLREKVP